MSQSSLALFGKSCRFVLGYMLIISMMPFAYAANTPPQTISLSLAKSGKASIEIQKGLYLEIDSDTEETEVKVIPAKHIPHCPYNLVHWAGHGPDASEIMPWSIEERMFSNPRILPVCGYPLKIRIDLVDVKTGSADKKGIFVSGKVIATVLPGKKEDGFWPD